ncbi:M15 family metallopeptidase [Granulicella sp. dw_53]|uniref:M15 family metallopeptidase n=1 Tax=Granulicella sp. dw_53 TaxID=2719792 RepID=UPI001BD50D56|nr:M15 family metallopeptidase [Granulicella sp. dw_53]
MSMSLLPADILYLQRTCAVCGCYAGPLDGTWSLDVQTAEDKLAAQAAEIRDALGTFDARTEKNIASLITPAQQIARQFMKAASSFNMRVSILSGTRTYAEQDALYAIGRTVQLSCKPVTKAKSGRSNHNFGIAWDVGLFDSSGRYLDGKNKGDEDTYKEFASLIKQHIGNIEWDGDWRTFVDLPH